MTIENHFIGKVAVKAIIRGGEKVLLVRDKNYPDTWELPGGRVNIDENIETALKREVSEELGVEVQVGQLIYSEQLLLPTENSPHLFIFLQADLTDPAKPFNVPSEEIVEAVWIDQEKLKDIKVFDDCDRALKSYWNL